MLQRVNRDKTLDQIYLVAQRFLTKRLGHPGWLQIDAVSGNVRNFQADMWDSWGTRMLKVWGNAVVTVSSLAPCRAVSFELELYLSRDGSELEMWPGTPLLPKPSFS